MNPHDIPDSAALVEAVREFLDSDVMPVVSGRVKFHTRVAVNVLGMVERELRIGMEQAEEHATGLARLGLEDEDGLAAAIRDGALD
ncbi:MAG: DUF6285 domain-containing protein, partial [Acidimicrobiales bacterium]